MNASQASSHFPLSPISAATLVAAEVERRNQARQLGPCKTGCRDVDEYVLLGGLERGSVVGVSADEESTGLCLGLQILSREVVGRRESKALVITPRPAADVLGSLRESIRAELGQNQSDDDDDDATTTTTNNAKSRCLDQVLLSQVFDMDGLWEVLSDLEPEAGDGGLPSVVVITHFSSLLTGLFAQRAKPAAMQNLALLAAHMRHLTRTLQSQPLILLLNTTASGEAQTTTTTTTGALDASLRSIFNPPQIDVAGYNNNNNNNAAAAAGGARRRNKPSFGLVFTQLLDVHLICWRLARTPAELPGDEVTVVEVLQDDLGLWQGKSGARPSREQRWTAVDVVRGRVLDAVLADECRGSGGGGGTTGRVVTSGGFGERRP